ncbi:hypothetical protein JAAARDRAFT_56545 [Jaapia argillacea MUCL 33604]|uniref:M-phase inducer phosphatase n=1 Tax=Jaapia argillacea MUCL 33604 TaxID=933084 RepID=A0A067PXW4_9AGAM|nr:hypothetical protein JAAARDRAFT_56545 [Jaapia argillacea MUCL 33604]
MAFFGSTTSTQFLAAPSAPTRKTSRHFQRQRDDIDDFLSSDLELSFASTMSLNSPPQDHIDLTPDHDSPVPMDISPAPPRPASPRSIIGKPLIRPRAFTSGARLFGRDMSNSATLALNMPPAPPSKPESVSSQAKRTQRPALPFEWLAQPQSLPVKNENMFVAPQAPSSPASGEAMDIDSSFAQSISAPTDGVLSSPAPISAASTITGFTNLFYETMSPCRSIGSPTGPVHKKRRSLSPEPVSRRLEDQENISSSPAPPSSPSQRKFERISSAPLGKPNKPSLSGLGNPSSNVNKRPRRPVMSALVPPSDHGLQSAFPILSSGGSSSSGEDQTVTVLPPVRRAFSAMLPPNFPSLANESFSSESSFEPDMSSPAQAYAKRQNMKTIRRCDGTEDFRPLTGATAVMKRDLQESPSAKFMGAGMPGFGDNEMHGKILPCHRVREDGLMRINPQTVDKLLDGVYDSKVANYHIIDCRFDYEYHGGHIPGAVNINTTTGVEEFLLSSGTMKPKPSVSGDAGKKTILIFHCEFSAKRAPTFAKHLRSKDRSMNNHVYPRIHYPEVYILEGGYSQYYKESSSRCIPCGYVQMDDPNHAASRREDIDQFRRNKFGRTKSYAYGDGGAKLSMFSQQTQGSKRHTAPSSNGPTSLFAAANAARTRRGGGNGLGTLPEDGNTTDVCDDEDTDIGDSPCPPPTKAAGVLQSKKLVRGPLKRAETYDPTRLMY